MRKFLLTFIIFVFLSEGITCCKNRATPATVTKMPTVDSVARIFKEIGGEEKAKKLDAYFQNLARTRGFNGSVLIAQRGIVIYKNAFGKADSKVKRPLTTATSFQLASVSKQFTAVCILMLKEKGLLTLDDAVQRFYPDFPYKGVTIRLMLEHRSGLPNYIYFTDQLVKDKESPLTNQQVMKLMCDHKPSAYIQPDRRFNYSNTNFMVLAAIVEKISGKSFKEFVDANIFTPLEMKHSAVMNFKDRPDSIIATGYNFHWRSAPYTFLDGVTGDKGIYCSVEDLYKWDQGLYGGKIIKPETLAEAFEPHSKTQKRDVNYGYGWRIFYLPDSVKVLYHGGWWEGFQTLLLRVQKDKTTIAILKNLRTGPIVEKSKVLQILYPETSFPGLNRDDFENDSLEGGVEATAAPNSVVTAKVATLKTKTAASVKKSSVVKKGQKKKTSHKKKRRRKR